jgi:hypothetical protein
LADRKLAEPPPFFTELNRAKRLASDVAPPAQPRPQGEANGPRGPPEFNFRKSPKKRFRGMPPPSTIDLSKLPDTTFLTEHEVAAILRRSKAVLEYWRKVHDHPLKWRRVAGRILYELPSIREMLKGGETGDT